MAEPRKIEMQSVEDLQHLIAVARRAANKEIDAALPRMENSDEDLMRKYVEEDIHNFVNKAWALTFPGITINGLSPDPDILKGDWSGQGVKEEYETFDSKSFERAKELARTEEDLIEEVAALRRSVPSQILDSTKRRYKQGMEDDESILKTREDRFSQMIKEQGNVVGIEKLERQDAVEKTWRTGIKGLQKVLADMPGAVAKSERAGRAESYVNGMEGK